MKVRWQVWNCPVLCTQPSFRWCEAVGAVEAGIKNQDLSQDSGSQPLTQLPAELLSTEILQQNSSLPQDCL